MDTARKIRAIVQRTLLLALIGAAVMLGLGRECLVLRWLHIPCLTCGMTRSLRALLQLDWRRSLHYHPLTVPFLIGFWLLFHYDLLGLSRRTIERVMAVLGGALVLFWAWRMLSGPQSWAFLLAPG